MRFQILILAILQLIFTHQSWAEEKQSAFHASTPGIRSAISLGERDLSNIPMCDGVTVWDFVKSYEDTVSDSQKINMQMKRIAEILGEQTVIPKLDIIGGVDRKELSIDLTLKLGSGQDLFEWIRKQRIYDDWAFFAYKSEIFYRDNSGNIKKSDFAKRSNTIDTSDSPCHLSEDKIIIALNDILEKLQLVENITQVYIHLIEGAPRNRVTHQSIVGEKFSGEVVFRESTECLDLVEDFRFTLLEIEKNDRLTEKAYDELTRDVAPIRTRRIKFDYSTGWHFIPSGVSGENEQPVAEHESIEALREKWFQLKREDLPQIVREITESGCLDPKS